MADDHANLKSYAVLRRDSRVANASVLAEQSMWRRRLAEVLATTINFAVTDQDDYYYHYLVLAEAIQADYDAKNALGDFGARSRVLDHRTKALRELLATLQQRIVLPVWYARNVRGQLLSQTASRIIRGALKLATPLQRTALAYSYAQAFATPSQAMHFVTTSRRWPSDRTTIRFGVSQLLLLNACICERVAHLAGVDFELSSSIAQHPNKGPWPTFETGDFVVVALDRESLFLGEVLCETRANGEPAPVRIRFLGERPYPSIEDDELPSDQVHLFQRRTELVNEWKNRSLQAPDVDETTLLDALRSAILQVWSLAGKRPGCASGGPTVIDEKDHPEV